MKRLLFAVLIVFTLLSGNISYIKAATLPKNIDSNGKKAEIYTSSDANATSSVKTSVSVSFIEDPNDSNLTALVSLKGFIPSRLNRYGTYYYGRMDWPSKYNIAVQSYDSSDKVKILQSIPSNTIEKVEVTETLGYSIGGSISKGSAEGNAGYNFERSVKYEQPDFKTIQNSDNLKVASWDIVFNKTKDGYDRDSHHPFFGNQIFMKSRLYNTGDKNFTDIKDLSTLISGGFTPDMAIALKAPKGMKKSQLILSYRTYHDLYSLRWSGTEWWGSNEQYTSSTSTNQTYEIDWENHTVKFIY
ncbi:alpha hemolysin [Clostridium perfringens]|uniref:Alpha hemolysin n=1 Tax=Clostridium perfringens TaxID=1502 RepID=A0A2X3ILK3_CLOPF|nr:leukocidin family pore-forming toxin [Clostridium perfringens]SQC85143.1 alpha hemolysin [Clostridium perfringens]